MPQISIIIPAYNAERFLVQTLDGVLAQTVADWELIIVDDGSIDNTAAMAQEYAECDARIRLVRQQNRGLPGARNRGYAASDPSSAYLIFLDADDVWEPDALAILLAAHRADPEAMIVYGLARYIDANGRPIDDTDLEITFKERYCLRNNKRIVVPWETPPDFENLILYNCIRTPGLVLIPRATLQTVGLFDPEGAGVADWDLWLRIALQGRIAIVPKVVLAYRLHTSNMSKGRENMIRSDLRMRKKTITSSRLNAQQRRQAIDAYSFVYLRGPHLSYITPARKLILAALSEKTPSIQASDGAEWEYPLLAALEGDAALIEKVACRAQHPQEPTALTLAERRTLMQALRALCRMEASIRWSWFVEFIKAGRLVPAAKHVYHGLPALYRLGCAHLLPAQGRETFS